MTPTPQKDIDGFASGAGLNLPFTSITGGGVTRETSDSRAPGGTYPDKVLGGAVIANVVCVTDFDRTVYTANVRSILRKSATNKTIFNIAKYIRDDASNIASTDGWTGYIVGVEGIDGDTNGGATKSTVTLTFAATGISSS